MSIGSESCAVATDATINTIIAASAMLISFPILRAALLAGLWKFTKRIGNRVVLLIVGHTCCVTGMHDGTDRACPSTKFGKQIETVIAAGQKETI